MKSATSTSDEKDLPALIAGRYRVEEHLGRGGAGEVLRVVDTSTGQQLALKRLDREASARLMGLFELEYQTLASLRHAHTVRVHEFGRDDSGAFYTMELLPGEDLKLLAPMPWHQVCSPDAIFGRIRSRCSGVPNSKIVGARRKMPFCVTRCGAAAR